MPSRGAPILPVDVQLERKLPGSYVCTLLLVLIPELFVLYHRRTCLKWCPPTCSTWTGVHMCWLPHMGGPHAWRVCPCQAWPGQQGSFLRGKRKVHIMRAPSSLPPSAASTPQRRCNAWPRWGGAVLSLHTAQHSLVLVLVLVVARRAAVHRCALSASSAPFPGSCWPGRMHSAGTAAMAVACTCSLPARRTLLCPPLCIAR